MHASVANTTFNRNTSCKVVKQNVSILKLVNWAILKIAALTYGISRNFQTIYLHLI